jgi:hypothetical protein
LRKLNEPVANYQTHHFDRQIMWINAVSLKQAAKSPNGYGEGKTTAFATMRWQERRRKDGRSEVDEQAGSNSAQARGGSSFNNLAAGVRVCLRAERRASARRSGDAKEAGGDAARAGARANGEA